MPLMTVVAQGDGSLEPQHYLVQMEDADIADMLIRTLGNEKACAVTKLLTVRLGWKSVHPEPGFLSVCHLPHVSI